MFVTGEVRPRVDGPTAEHWLLKPGWFFEKWVIALWVSDRQVWRVGRREITPAEAARKRWRYTGPLMSPAELSK